MKYAVEKVVNGNYAIDSEHDENRQSAFVSFHNLCASLWNSSDVITATVRVIDENLNTVEAKIEYINHPEEPEPEE